MVRLIHSKPKSADVKVEREQGWVLVSFAAIALNVNSADTRSPLFFLALCMQIVKLMGGRMGVDSQLGVGSTFW
jgi:hypothetical protein